MTHPGLTDGPIYLDYNATTPIDPRVVDAALPYLTHHFGNPSSSHTYAAKPRAAIAAAGATATVTLQTTFEPLDPTGADQLTDIMRGAFQQSLESLRRIIEDKVTWDAR